MKLFFLFVITAISSSAYYSPETTLNGSLIRLLLRLFLACLCFALLFLSKYKIKLFITPLIIITSLVYLLRLVDNYDTTLVLPMAFIEMFIFSFLNVKEKGRIFLIFRQYLVFLSVVGVITYFSYVFNLGIPYNIQPYYCMGGPSKGLYYINYGLSLLYKGPLVLRLCGLFNEPGFFGTIIALVLIVDRLNLRKKSNLLMFIAGCLTFSLAFLVLMLLYIVLINIKRPRVILNTMLILAVLFCSINFMDDNSKHLFNRFFSFNNGKWDGDNRSTQKLNELMKDMFNEGDNIYWGWGNGFEQKGGIGLSYKKYFLMFGVLGFFMLFGMLFLSSIYYSGLIYHGIVFIACFFASIYQRPDVFNIYYFVILFGGLAYIKLNCYHNFDKITMLDKKIWI